ncbi:MAG TPA: ABC transporter permease [Thermoanaerobaculaceae bacterium]|nr:ABC transporter permease [Thermoanaerobaculaceae bacterium]HRS15446.1 ABC transporter permease [Thermoanaerobaculaceae bacterium]
MLQLAAKDLASRPGRSLLTAVGIGVGVATYLMVFASMRTYLSQFRVLSSLLGTSLLVQQEGAPSPFSSFLAPVVVARLAAVPRVLAAHPAALARVRALGASSLVVAGFEPDGALARRIPLVAGRLPRPGAGELLVGTAAAERLQVRPGHVLSLRGLQFSVVGVFRTDLGMLDAGGLTDMAGAQTLGNLREAISFVLLEVEPGRESEVKAAVAERLPGVETLDAGGYVGTIGVSRITNAFISLLGVVVVLIVTLGVANALQAAVYERREELALLRAIGWSPGLVARLILHEVALLAAGGCTIGLALAFATLQVLRLVGPQTLRTSGILPGYVPPPIALAGVLVGFAACFLGALGPLVRALRVRPWEGLRSP